MASIPLLILIYADVIKQPLITLSIIEKYPFFFEIKVFPVSFNKLTMITLLEP